MKKIAAILIIITSSINLIISLISFPNLVYEMQYWLGEGGLEGLNYWFPQLFVYPLSSIAFILLGIALMKDGNSSNISHQNVPAPKVTKSKTPDMQNNLNPNDVPSTGLNIVCFLIPLVGLIIYLTEKDKSPKKASSAGKAALWGVGVSVVLSIISIIISVVMVSSMY